MGNVIKKVLQMPWKPFKRRFDKLDRAAKDVRVVLRQVENNSLVLGSFRRETRESLRELRAEVEQLTAAVDTLAKQQDAVLQSINGTLANDDSNEL